MFKEEFLATLTDDQLELVELFIDLFIQKEKTLD